jgi:hypothetical protein
MAGLAIAHAVFVRQFAFQYIADDLHVSMGMRAKSGSRGNAIFIDHAQVSHAHMARIMVASEGEAVVALEPTVIGITALTGLAKDLHRAAPDFLAMVAL